MKKLLIFFLLLAITSSKAAAAEINYTAPPVPDSGAAFMEDEPDSFFEGLLFIWKNALPLIHPALNEAVAGCASVVGIVVLMSVVGNFTGIQLSVTRLIGVLAIASVLLTTSKVLIPLGADTVSELSVYGKLLLPVMTGALAAQGNVTASGALYMGTAFFSTLLTRLIDRMLVPMVYGFLTLAVAGAALQNGSIEKLKELIKSTIIWLLKIVLYIFTGYMTISGAVSGSTDAMAMKAAKVTISGVVPVVGGILADASEAVLVSASVMKHAAGVYGILAVIAIAVGPFIRLGTQYLVIKLTGALCESFGCKPLCGFIHDVSSATGLVLAMTAAVGLMVLISTVCFMRVTA